jgi:hypothetical protein
MYFDFFYMFCLNMIFLMSTKRIEVFNYVPCDLIHSYLLMYVVHMRKYCGRENIPSGDLYRVTHFQTPEYE